MVSSTRTAVITPSTTGYSQISTKPTRQPPRHPGLQFFAPVRSSYFSFGRITPQSSQVLHQLSGDTHMEEINSILYDMHGTAHVILIAALFLILLVVR